MGTSPNGDPSKGELVLGDSHPHLLWGHPKWGPPAHSPSGTPLATSPMGTCPKMDLSNRILSKGIQIHLSCGDISKLGPPAPSPRGDLWPPLQKRWTLLKGTCSRWGPVYLSHGDVSKWGPECAAPTGTSPSGDVLPSLQGEAIGHFSKAGTSLARGLLPGWGLLPTFPFDVSKWETSSVSLSQVDLSSKDPFLPLWPLSGGHLQMGELLVSKRDLCSPLQGDPLYMEDSLQRRHLQMARSFFPLQKKDLPRGDPTLKETSPRAPLHTDLPLFLSYLQAS